MLSRTLSSLQHPFVKHAVKLRSDRSARQHEKQVLVCGIKLVNELSVSYPLKALIHTEAFQHQLKADASYLVTEDVMKKISGMQSPEPVAAIIDIPKEADLSHSNYLLVLDNLADPGNVGTLLRTALALGWQGAFLLDNCCDPYNEKALRAAKGATFHLPIQTGSWAELMELLKQGNYTCYVADMRGIPYFQATRKPPVALILGNESQGPRQEAKESFTALCIPMSGAMESLNVASAGAILLQNLRGML